MSLVVYMTQIYCPPLNYKKKIHFFYNLFSSLCAMKKIWWITTNATEKIWWNNIWYLCQDMNFVIDGTKWNL